MLKRLRAPPLLPLPTIGSSGFLRISHEASHDGPHDRRTDSIAKELDPIAPRTVIQDKFPWQAHRSLEFRNLEHSQGRFPTFPAHETEAVECGQCSKRAIERLVAARFVGTVIHGQEVLAFPKLGNGMLHTFKRCLRTTTVV